MTLQYSAYGLRLQADQPIPGLVPSITSEPADVQIHLGRLPSWIDGELQVWQVWYVSEYLDEHNQPSLAVWKSACGEYFRLRYADTTEFVVDRSGAEVWAIWPATLTLEDTATYLLGPVFGFILLLRGTISLHASAFAIDGQAVALLGPAGAGKSTTAAAFARMGRSVLTDDVLALTDQGDVFGIQPAYGRIRLWPESVSALYGQEDALPRLTPTWDKRYLDLIEDGDRFQAEPLPLGAIYILGERSDDPSAPFVESISTHEGLMTLVTETYTTYLMDKPMRARGFELLGRVMANVPVRRVVPHADVTHLFRLCQVIVEDYQRMTESASLSAAASAYGSMQLNEKNCSPQKAQKAQKTAHDSL